MKELTAKLKNKVLVGIIFSVLVLAGALLLPPLIRTALAATSGKYEYAVNEDGTTATITGYTGAGGDITIPDTVTDGTNTYTVTAIGDSAFRDMTTVISVMIPDDVTSIGASAFSGCTALRSAYFLGNAPSADESTFGNCATDFTVYYESASTDFSDPWNGYPASVFNPNVTYTVTFDLNGVAGTVPDVQAVYEGVKAVCPTDPSFGEKIFGGWYTETACTTAWNFDTAVTSNLSLFALWKDFNGSGTEEDPYQVSTPAQLNAVRNYADACFIMTNDIDMTEATSEGGAYWNDGAGWEMLCPSSDPFLGSFDGNGKEISGLSNLFSYIGNDTESGKTGHVFSLSISGILAVTNEGIIENVSASRGIAGVNKGIIENACTSGSISGHSGGGLVNTNYGLITKCVSKTNVDMSFNAAGIAKTNLGTISGCYNTGNINGETGSAGIVYMNYGIVENCFNAGYVKDNNGVGGIVGWNESTIRNCYNIGGLDSDVVVPGAITQRNQEHGSVENCFFLDTIENGIGTGTGTTANVAALSESAMMNAASYIGFDFETIWSIDNQENYPYPQLVGNPYSIEENIDEFEGGCGLPANPYKISSPVQLNNMRNYPGSWFEIINDIDMSEPNREGGEFYNDGEGWIPIGNYFLSFMGGLDGNGYIIKGIYINSSDDYWNNGTGLFGNLGTSARIKNVGIVYSDISGKENVGSIAGINKGCIENCYCDGIVRGFHAGGIAGENYQTGSIKNCYNLATVCDGGTGGISAYNYGKIQYCYNVGAVGANYGSAGSITFESYGTIEHCRYLDISTYGIKNDMGSSEDVCAKSESELHFEDSFEGFDFSEIWTMSGESSYPYPKLSATMQVPISENTTEFQGGTGYSFSPFQITTAEELNNVRKYPGKFYTLRNNVDLLSETTGGGTYYYNGKGWDPIENFMGGFEGNGYAITGLTINRPDESNVGLFATAPFGTAYIYNLVLRDVNVIGDNDVGGLVGKSGATIKNVYAYGNITGNGSAGVKGTGGIIGNNFGFIDSSSNLCNVKGSYAGGITGVSSGVINRCSNYGMITGVSCTGGIVGSTSSDISNCINVGEVKHIAGYSGISVGGIVGYMRPGNISSCYNTGDVYISNGMGYLGGIAGYTYNTEIIYCYFIDTNEEGIGYVGYGAEDNTYSKNSEELKLQATFNGFDFYTVWTINENVDLPHLQNLLLFYPDEITLNVDSRSLIIGENMTLSVFANPDNTIIKSFKWVSSDRNVITVDQNGFMVAVGVGNATITVMNQDESCIDTCDVTVEPKRVSSVSLSKDIETMIDGSAISLVAEVLPSDATYPTVTWSSSDQSVATVNQEGTVTAIAPGSVKIYATADGKTDFCEITVNKVAVSKVNISNKPDNDTMIIGDSRTLSATVSPSNATYPMVTWSSSKTAIASVDQTGKVIAVAPGNATITATADGVSAFYEVMVVPPTYYITATVNNAAYGTVTGGGSYDKDASVTLTATPKAGYRFVRWSTGITQLSTSIQYTLRANADQSITAEFAPIGTPTLYAASAGYTSARLAWTAVEGAAGYEVWRSASAGGTYSRIGTVTGTSYTDNSLTTNTPYYYKVNAYCVASTATTYGSQSAYASATPVPAAATVYASPTNYNSAYVSWNAVPGASGYELSRSTSQNSGYSVVKTTSSLSYTNSSLNTGTTYYYRVRAYRTVGRTKAWGDYSALTSATPVLSSVISASASAYYPTSIKVSWSAVSGRTKYEVLRSDSATGTYTRIGSTTSTYYKDTTCTPFVTYYYQIKVYRTVNRLPVYSSGVSPTASATPILGNVSGVKAAVSSPSSVNISWASVTGASGYEVLRSTKVDGVYVSIKSTTSRSFTDTSCTPNTTYYYQVRAYRKVGGGTVPSAPSAAVSATPYFGSISNAKAVRSSTTGIKLTWSAVSGRTGYEIYRRSSPDSDFVLIKNTTSTSFTDSGLTTGVTYEYKIVAYRTVNGVKYRSTESVVSATP